MAGQSQVIMASAEDSGSGNAPGEHSLDYHPLEPLGAEVKQSLAVVTGYLPGAEVVGGPSLSSC